jgi:hypothetical protein
MYRHSASHAAFPPLHLFTIGNKKYPSGTPLCPKIVDGNKEHPSGTPLCPKIVDGNKEESKQFSTVSEKIMLIWKNACLSH